MLRQVWESQFQDQHYEYNQMAFKGELGGRMFRKEVLVGILVKSADVTRLPLNRFVY